MADFNEKFDELNNTPDTTAEFSKDDIEQNRIMAVFAYLSWLVIIPLVAAKDSKFAKFHANQGLVLAITEIVIGVFLGVLRDIPVLGIIFSIAGSLLSLACFILMVLGIINAANGKAKELPIIGGVRIFK